MPGASVSQRRGGEVTQPILAVASSGHLARTGGRLGSPPQDGFAVANLSDASGKMPKLQNTYLPRAIFPALIAFPEERKCNHRIAWPLCCRKICKPQIQSVLEGRPRFV